MTAKSRGGGDQPGGTPGEAARVVGGGAVADVVREAATLDLADLPGAATDDPIAFTTAVLDYLHDRSESQDAPPISHPAAFVWSEYPRRDGERLHLQRLRGFRFEKQRELSGAIYLAGSALNDVYESPNAAADLNGLFERVASDGFGGRPTVAILAGGQEAVLCPNGVESEETCVRLPLRSATVSREAVDDLLNEFYENWLKTPQDFAPVWHSPNHRVPAENTEKVIEGLLFPFARATFRTTHIVRREDEMLSGRADISILPRPDRLASGSCVVELKVLRSRHYHLDPRKATVCAPTINEQAIVDGLNQGLSYRQDLSCELAFLCCYDMRSENSDAILQQYTIEASEKGVDLRRYYLYGSSKEYRGSKPDAVRRRRSATKKSETSSSRKH